MQRLFAFLVAIAASSVAFANGGPPSQGESPTTFTNDPVVSPTIVGPTTTVAPTINPVIAPTTVVAPTIAPRIDPIIAPVIAPKVDTTDVNLNSVNNRVNVGVGVNTEIEARNTNANAVVVSPTVSPRQDQSQTQRQDQAQNQGQNQNQTSTSAAASNQTQSANNANTVAPIQSLTYNEAAAPSKVTIRSIPNVSIGVASAINNDLCVASASIGGSGVGFGFGIGLQYRDEDCVRRINSRQLFNMGFQRAAVLLMAQDANVRQALQDAGVDLGNITVPEQPKAQVLTTNAR